MGTSRGVLKRRVIYLIALSAGRARGIGECAPLPGLSPDYEIDLSSKLSRICEQINGGTTPTELDLDGSPALRFALEAALIHLKNPGRGYFDESDFVKHGSGIPTNGLVVMSDVEDMFQQVRRKVAAGFDCIKIKIGALDFDAECKLLERVRERFSAKRVELRLDANGAFDADDALRKLNTLANYHVHSIEQPIKPRQWATMAKLCRASPIPIALDEELIGLNTDNQRSALLQKTKPQFIVLKPTLVGGLVSARAWIQIAAAHDVGYWVTSALESNIGLNIVSQWTATLRTALPQGLGTGRLFQHNFPSPLRIAEGELRYSRDAEPPAVPLTELKLSEHGCIP